jgi:hypothetical protein
MIHAHRAPSNHTWLLFESRGWQIQKSLSELNGTDPYIHGGPAESIFRELAKDFAKAFDDIVVFTTALAQQLYQQPSYTRKMST